ncbi:decaprenyl-phosphate phosphoribosyltransferase [bacterium]|nr:decaprenyl-phosphate phosphoribosyltransferase [bacterium]MBU1636057.1 decaprenyl-phosphate phosphoribosyltransferase [bacterium]MBU1919643.1 decaprenyl-phosphate phosphoribosyltransferase [bacterium]
MLGIIQLIRPAQWSKNLILFTAVLFSPARVVAANPAVLLRATQGFLVFCLLSGSVYALNDLLDLDADRNHPKKKNRPIPSGKVTPSGAAMISLALGIVGIAWAFLLDFYFGWIAVAYLAANLSYSLGLKRVAILDVLLLSLGFVFRAVAGVAVIRLMLPDVYLSYWLVLCAFLLSLFLALSKRRHEISLLGEDAAKHRASLADYNLLFIDQMIAILTAATLVAYSLYTISDDTLAHYGTRNLFWTLPFVVYGLFRYLYLIYRQGKGGDPSSLLLRDKPTLANVVLWGVATAGIVYYG